MACVLVIGSAHLDVVADYDTSLETCIDKPGNSIECGIGGTAFNIASNLAHFSRPGTKVEFATCIKKGSLSESLIRSAINRIGIRLALIVSEGVDSESGYVAHWSSGRLRSAVSCSGLERAIFRRSDLARVIGVADVVAMDTNLTEAQIGIIRDLCWNYGKPLLVGCVSERKVLRIKSRGPDSKASKYVLVSMNAREAQSFFGSNFEKNSDPEYICDQAQSENVIITNASDGFAIYASTGKLVLPAPGPVEVVSELGAGDALFSACCEYFLYNGSFDWNLCYPDIKRYVIPILSVRQATIDKSRPSRFDSDPRSS